MYMWCVCTAGAADFRRSLLQTRFMGTPAGAIRVAVRVRPYPNSERSHVDGGYRGAIVTPPNIVTVSTRPEGKPGRIETRQFSFDAVLDEAASQADVFDAVGKGPCLACVSGYNSTVFAYGQTGAGANCQRASN